MAQVNKIDSNITGLAYAEEAQLGLLPGEGGLGGTPVWYRLEPNSYNDFGGSITTVAPNTINPNRRRRKGVTTDLEAAGGINHNITFENLTHLMQGMMFADIRRKGRQLVTAVDGTAETYAIGDTTGFVVGGLVRGKGFTNSGNNVLSEITAVSAGTSITTDANLVEEAAPPTGARVDVVGVAAASADINVNGASDYGRLTSTTLDFTTLGLVPGQWVYIGGDAAGTSFVNAANNGFKRVKSIAANELVLDKSNAAMVDETGTGLTIHIYFGDVLRDESGSLIKRRTYNVERTLGAPDDALPAQIQSEVLKGAVPNEFSLNVPSAELATVDFSFMATDNEQRTGADGPKQSSVQTFLPATEYNTSTDVGRIRLAIISDTNEAPQALFAYVTEITITINNNVTPNKAVGVLGAFEVTAGTFEVSGSMTAYFATVEATQAVRNNENVSLDLNFVKDNEAMVYDMPLVALGDGRLNVEVDQPITLPLTPDAASGQDYDLNLDHTLLITYFNYVPDAAEA